MLVQVPAHCPGPQTYAFAPTALPFHKAIRVPYATMQPLFVWGLHAPCCHLRLVQHWELLTSALFLFRFLFDWENKPA